MNDPICPICSGSGVLPTRIRNQFFPYAACPKCRRAERLRLMGRIVISHNESNRRELQEPLTQDGFNYDQTEE